MTPTKVLRDGKFRDDRPTPTARQKVSVDHARDQVDGLREIGPLGQDSDNATISQNIHRLRMMEKILEIRELFELDSLIGRDLAHTHDYLMDMTDAAFQDFMGIIAAKMGRMSGVGLPEERTAYDDDTIFGWFSDLLEDLCSDDGGGRFDDPDEDGIPNAIDDDGDGVKDKNDAALYAPDVSIFLKTKSGCCPPAFQESWSMNSCTSGSSTAWTMDHFWKVIFISCCIWRSRTGCPVIELINTG
ncbi:MAG: hypothetical protein CMJ69_15170 [Planctomycetaceae bacterium]|nr:hypothetical protein [Planctomycetaceae bacterium]